MERVLAERLAAAWRADFDQPQAAVTRQALDAGEGGEQCGQVFSRLFGADIQHVGELFPVGVCGAEDWRKRLGYAPHLLRTAVEMVDELVSRPVGHRDQTGGSLDPTPILAQDGPIAS